MILDTATAAETTGDDNGYNKKHFNMRRDTLVALGGVCLIFWAGIYFLFSLKPGQVGSQDKLEERSRLLEDSFEGVQRQLKVQIRTNKVLLDKLKLLRSELGQNKDAVVDIDSFIQLLEDPDVNVDSVVKIVDKTKPKVPAESFVNEVVDNNQIVEDNVNRDSDNDDDIDVEPDKVQSKPIIPILVFSCNRVTVNKALDLLISYRPSKEQYPIIVTQDCNHEQTRNVIQSYGDQVIYIQQPDQSDPVLPEKEKKFKGYFKIARHYGWALNQTFMEMGFDQVVIVEDDLEISPDFYEYFTATLPLLKTDPSLWCVSAWNDNGKAGLINQTAPELLYRTDFFPGLGWMLTKTLWQELMVKWARSYWDDWMRLPEQRRGRSCIRPEISRTKTFGKIGVSNGLFFEKHLKYIVLNDKFVPFTVMDLSVLEKEKYDESFVGHVYSTPVVKVEDVKRGHLDGRKTVRITYFSSNDYKRAAKQLGIMDDFKSGVPRMAYRGIVTFIRDNVRVYLAPNNNWQGYDPKWS